jgi:hypothetical protein
LPHAGEIAVAAFRVHFKVAKASVRQLVDFYLVTPEFDGNELVPLRGIYLRKINAVEVKLPAARFSRQGRLKDICPQSIAPITLELIASRRRSAFSSHARPGAGVPGRKTGVVLRREQL